MMALRAQEIPPATQIAQRVVLVTDPKTGKQLRFISVDTVRDIASCLRHASALFQLPRGQLAVQLGERRGA